MPERMKAVDRLVKALNDGVSYNNLHLTMKVNGKTLSSDERWAFFDKYDEAYEDVIRGIDWNRVLLEALGCHMARQEANPEHKTQMNDYGDEICPDCVMEALLADSTFKDWRKVAEHLENHTKPCKDCGDPIPEDAPEPFCKECLKFQEYDPDCELCIRNLHEWP